MISEEEFVEKVLEIAEVRCPECGRLKNEKSGVFCLSCYKEARAKRIEKYESDAMMFGREFFLGILDWIELYMEPEDVFTEPSLNDWAARNGWVPEEEDAIASEVTKSDVDAVFAKAKKNIAKLRESTNEFGGKDSDNLITRVYAEMADAMDNLADAVYGLVEDDDETE